MNTRENKTALWLCLVLVIGTWACYHDLSSHTFINFDDRTYVVDNQHVIPGITWSGFTWALRTGFFCSWHPLTWLSHMLDCTLYGLNPAGHHLTSLVFHVANTLLLFLFLRRVTGAVWRS